MKDKVLFVLKGVVITAVVLCCFCGVYYFVDVVLNHAVGDWFEEKFLVELFAGYDSAGNIVHTKWFLWDRFKTYLLVGCVAVILIWGISLMVSESVAKKRERERVLAQTGKLLKATFAGQSIEKIPKEYELLSRELSEIRVELMHKEQALKDETAKKNDLIAYLAHDLKTPLTSVVGYLSLLEEAPDMPAEQRAKYTHITLEKALRLEQLINEFFDITRYNLHEIVLEKERLDLSYMLAQMTDEFYPVLAQHGNTLSLAVQDELYVMADADKLARVFNNILKNAIAYSNVSSPICVSAERRGARIVVTFSNHGRTIPKQKLEAIFEKFYRLDDARSSNTGGAGLGLAIAKQIVTLHGGTITAESENGVTTFRVELPI